MVSDLFGRAWINKTLIFFYFFAGSFSYLGGAFSDRFGRKNGFLAAFTSGFLGIIILAFWPTLLNIVLASVLLGVVFGMVPTVTVGLIGDRIKPKDRALTLAAFFFWRDIGIAGSIFLGGVLLQSSPSYKNVLLPFAVLFLGLTVLFCRKPEEGMKV
ncbi:MAG: MFS transporter [Candidatus Ratteibacteria bacterium]|jgi:MFS family permease